LKTQPTDVHRDQEPPPVETMFAAGIGGAAGAGAGAGAGTGLGLAVGVEPPPQPTMTTVTTTINNCRIINPFEELVLLRAPSASSYPELSEVALFCVTDNSTPD